MIHSDIFGQLAIERQAELVAEAAHQRLVREVRLARRAGDQTRGTTLRHKLSSLAIVRAVLATR